MLDHANSVFNLPPYTEREKKHLNISRQKLRGGGVACIAAGNLEICIMKNGLEACVSVCQFCKRKLSCTQSLFHIN